MKRLLLCTLLLAACAAPNNISVTRMGGLYPAQPVGCPIKFENLTYQQAQERYQIIGLITLTGGSAGDFDDKMKATLSERACRMGGDAVTLNASNDFNSKLVGSMTQFLVLRRHAPDGAPPPAGTAL